MSDKTLTTTDNDKIKLTAKFKKWCEVFYDKSNKTTYLNATQSALAAYDCTYDSARRIGSENLAKLSNVRQAIAEADGFDLHEMMKIGMAKVIKGGFGDWERMMVILGHLEDPKNPAPQQNLQVNVNLSEAIAQSRKERGLDP